MGDRGSTHSLADPTLCGINPIRLAAGLDYVLMRSLVPKQLVVPMDCATQSARV